MQIDTFVKTTLKSILVLAAASVLLAGAARVRADEEQPGWKRSVALGLSIKGGNSDIVLVTSKFDAQRAWERDEWLFSVDTAYGTTDGSKSAEVGHGSAQYKRLMDSRWYFSAAADLLHDGVADLAYRFTLGPGIGYYFIKSDRTKLSAEVGPSYVRKKLDGQNAEDFIALRLGERWEHQLNETAKVWQSLDITPQISDFENYQAVFEVGIETAVTKSMNLRVVGQDRYDNKPAAGLKRNDTSLVAALAYNF
jgi:putative salt-induced outer membrane protein YdiY